MNVQMITFNKCRPTDANMYPRTQGYRARWSKQWQVVLDTAEQSKLGQLLLVGNKVHCQQDSRIISNDAI